MVACKPQNGGDGKMKDTMIGVDLAKNVFQTHGASMTGHRKYSKRLTRLQFRKFMAAQPPAMVVLEACGSAHYWAREMIKFGRNFAAWLDLVPRQHSSGGKDRLRRVSKAGQTDIRRLLIIGAMSRLNWLGRKSIPERSWLARLLQRKPKMLVAIALANKMAWAIWAMLTKNEDYRDPAQAVAA
jgi:transposase